MSSFDWDWSDYARVQTHGNRPGQTCKAASISNGCNALRFTLFECLADQTGDLEHPVYELYTLEAELDLGASILLAFGGYYKQAGISLRSFLELAFLSMYYADHRLEYDTWKKDLKARSPPFHGKGDDNVLGYLFGQTPLRTCSDLKGKASDLYTELSKFVHTSAIDMLDLWRGRDNVPRFLPRSFGLWFRYLERTHHVTALSLLFRYQDEIGTYLKDDRSGLWQDIVRSTGKQVLKRYGIDLPSRV